jgi:hypothetical protein
MGEGSQQASSQYATQDRCGPELSGSGAGVTEIYRIGFRVDRSGKLDNLWDSCPMVLEADYNRLETELGRAVSLIRVLVAYSHQPLAADITSKAAEFLAAYPFIGGLP